MGILRGKMKGQGYYTPYGIEVLILYLLVGVPLSIILLLIGACSAYQLARQKKELNLLGIKIGYKYILGYATLVLFGSAVYALSQNLKPDAFLLAAAIVPFAVLWSILAFILLFLLFRTGRMLFEASKAAIKDRNLGKEIGISGGITVKAKYVLALFFAGYVIEAVLLWDYNSLLANWRFVDYSIVTLVFGAPLVLSLFFAAIVLCIAIAQIKRRFRW